MDFLIGMFITAFFGFLVVKFVLLPMLAPLDEISEEDFKEAFGYDKNFQTWEITNAFLAFFVAFYFYLKCKCFGYLLLSKRFFGVKFKFLFNQKDIFQFIVEKGYEAMHGARIKFSFLNLYKELKRLLNGICEQKIKKEKIGDY